ncbi:hypothetical protein KL86APRO_11356 [uncultured Alphaproteobacteria bacterium]|uniref:Uncharacterized protein n=1 Tax=uncultured Alphaproteobacteria bacterium TaxID=91750 RepID=A0A212JNM2_9PROT|nr:hypothetical protein KL86APRO_11356 [uncultured Alphaproteobacteria bacterium]
MIRTSSGFEYKVKTARTRIYRKECVKDLSGIVKRFVQLIHKLSHLLTS